MRDDVVVLTIEDVTQAQQVLQDLKETAQYLGKPHLAIVQIGESVMECAVFAPNGWTDDADANGTCPNKAAQ